MFTKTDTGDFTKLEVWKRAHKLSLDIYNLVKKFPIDERYRMTDQIIRSSRSVPANIAEGHGRYYYQENIAFCRKSRGSLDETRNHLLEIKELNLLDDKMCDGFIQECLEIRMLLNGYIRYLKTKKPSE